MPTANVWSEQVEPNANGWRDCTYSAALMACVHGGQLDYPLGIYTVEEREALERSDSRPDEEGANAGNATEAVLNRYGRQLHSPAPGQTLRNLLDTPNLCLVVPGRLSNLPLGHWLRATQPTFTGAHRIAVDTLRGGFECRWLDPLRPMGYPGDVTDPSDVETFFGDMPTSELRYTVLDEWLPAPTPEPTPEPTPPADPCLSQADVDAAVRAEYARVTAGTTARRVRVAADGGRYRYVIRLSFPEPIK